MKNAKWIFLTITGLVFSLQISANIRQGKAQNEEYLFRQKLAVLQFNALLAEKDNNSTDRENQYRLLAQACRDASSVPMLDLRTKKLAQRELAMALFRLNEAEEALKVCNELLKTDKTDKKALEIKAEIYWEQGKDLDRHQKEGEALKKYSEVASWKISRNLDAYFMTETANLLFRQRKFDEAQSWYQKILSDKKQSRNWQACALYFSGIINNCKGNKKSALENFKKITEEFGMTEWAVNAANELKNLELGDPKKG